MKQPITIIWLTSKFFKHDTFQNLERIYYIFLDFEKVIDILSTREKPLNYIHLNNNNNNNNNNSNYNHEDGCDNLNFSVEFFFPNWIK